MNNPEKATHPVTREELMDSLIQFGVVAVLVLACLRVFSPFMNLILWSLILAVTLYPLHQKLAARLGGKEGRAATIIALIGFVLLVYPAVKLGGSLAEQFSSAHDAFEAGTLTVPAPPESVAEWPLVGKPTYQAWSNASANLGAFIENNQATVESLLRKALDVAKGTATNLLMFLGALAVAGVMMAYGRAGAEATRNVIRRFVGAAQAPEIQSLATMTTRSVAVGVLGVAVIQALLMGVGFILAGVPAAGLLALIVLLLAIMQLPALLVALPVIVWLWNGDGSTVMNTVWTVYILAAGASDNVLKPMLLGRGVDAPMPVILLGALGGMMSSGFIGLFIGAVVLAVGYQVFMRWVAMHGEAGGDEAAAESAE